jgi:hypothetical protein
LRRIPVPRVLRSASTTATNPVVVSPVLGIHGQPLGASLAQPGRVFGGAARRPLGAG